MSAFKPGDTCMVVRNTTGDECRAAAVGRFVIKLEQSGLATLQIHQGWSATRWRGVVWSYQGEQLLCPISQQRCESFRVFPHADLMKLPEEDDVREQDEQAERLDKLAQHIADTEPQPAWRTDP